MQTEEKTYGIIPASSGVFIFLWGFVIFILAIFLVTSLNSGFDAASIAVELVVFLGVGGVLGFFAYQSRHAAFSITGQGLKIGPGLYGRVIPWDKIDVSGVRMINLKLEKQYQAKWRMNGAGLPGYAAGWFKLYNTEKALLFVTDSSNVVYIPTTENYSVLLSTKGADAMVETIRRWRK